jgi:hypothetical protein
LVVDEVIGDGRLALIQRHAEAGQCMFLPIGVPFETARSVARPSLARDRADQFRDAKFTTAKPKTNKSINWIADTRPWRTGVLGLQIECSHASRAVEQRFCVMIGLASTLIRPANYCSPWKSIERKPSSIERKVHYSAR